MTTVKRLIAIVIALSLGVVFAACGNNASTVDKNLKQEANKFNLVRSITVTNGITGQVIYYIQGRCAFFDYGRRVDVICREGADYSTNAFRKITVKLGDQDDAVVAQLKAVNVSQYRTKIIFRPKSIVPDLDLVTAGS